MKRSTFLAFMLVGFFAQETFAQTSVTIDSTNVENKLVLAAGKITLSKDETHAGTALYILDTSKVAVPGFINFAALPAADKKVDWDGQFTVPSAGEWKIVIQVKYLDKDQNPKELTQTKTVTVN
jgi:hypothetical protein